LTLWKMCLSVRDSTFVGWRGQMHEISLQSLDFDMVPLFRQGSAILSLRERRYAAATS